MYTLNCKGKLLVIDKPLVMGILNITPDSFYDQHLPKGIDAIMAQADKMICEGVDILDIGGQTTKPGSKRISAPEEQARVLPVIELLRQKNPDLLLSIDTYYAAVAIAAVNAGAVIVNDISGGNMDEAMLQTVAALEVPFICMHMKGTPETMQQNASYVDVVKEVLDYFIGKLAVCAAAGIKDVIIDPGVGFGKTIQHNFTLLKNLSAFHLLDKPILAGLSRKGTIYKTLNISAEEALNGTTVLNTLALLNGANIIRVHDVKESKEIVTLLENYKQA